VDLVHSSFLVSIFAKLSCPQYPIVGQTINLLTVPPAFGWSTLDSILFQFPLGGIVLVFILLTGFLSSRIPNIIIIQLILCALPVIAGCAIIWKSTWSYHAAAPVVGYTIIGFFGPVVSLIIIVGMANVAGATKKSLMAANIFVAYCVGNIVGPQLIKSNTRTQHYPELWLGLIIW